MKVMAPIIRRTEVRQPRFLWITAIAGAFLVGYLAHPWLRFHLHFVLAQVCHGVSAGKVLFLLGFLMVCGVRLSLSAIRGTQRPGSDYRAVAFFGVSGVGLAAALLSWGLYIHQYQLPLDWPTFHWRDGINSVNYFNHIHTSKTVIAHVLIQLGLPQWCERFDAGAPYVSVVPPWLAWVIGGCFIASLVPALREAASVVNGYPGNERLVVALVWGLASAAVCKSILDGGPLAYDSVAGLLTVWVLARSRSVPCLWHYILSHWRALVLTVLGWLVCLAAIDSSCLAPQIERFVYRISVYLLPLVWADRHRWRPVITPLVAGRALLPLVVAMLFAVRAGLQELFPMWSPAPAKAIVYRMPASSSSDTGDTSANAKVEATPCLIEEGTSYLNAYLGLGENPQRARQVSLACTRPGRPTGLHVDLIVLAHHGEQLALPATRIVTVKRVAVVEQGRHPRLRAQIEFSEDLGPVLWHADAGTPGQIIENERFVAYHLLDHYLRSCGVTEYILIPYAQYAAPAAMAEASTTTE